VKLPHLLNKQQKINQNHIANIIGINIIIKYNNGNKYIPKKSSGILCIINQQLNQKYHKKIKQIITTDIIKSSIDPISSSASTVVFEIKKSWSIVFSSLEELL